MRLVAAARVRPAATCRWQGPDDDRLEAARDQGWPGGSCEENRRSMVRRETPSSLAAFAFAPPQYRSVSWIARSSISARVVPNGMIIAESSGARLLDEACVIVS